MSLQVFQQVLSEMVASPRICLELREAPDLFLRDYDLTERERCRLRTVVWQPGMSTTCSLYRANRLAALTTLLPLTCQVLGDSLRVVVDGFWELHRDSDLQFVPECERFVAFVRDRLHAGAIENPSLEEVMDFEQASFRVQSAV